MNSFSNLNYQQRISTNSSRNKFIVFIIGVLIVVAIAVVSFLFFSLSSARNEEAAVNKIAKQNNLSSVTKIKTAGTSQQFYSFEAKNSSGGKKVVIFSSSGGNQQIVDYNSEFEGEKLLAFINKQYNPKNIYNVGFVETNNKIGIEISFEDQNGLQNYVTIDYKDGTEITSIKGI